MMMKIKHILLTLIMLSTTGSLFAQKLFTLEELNFGGKNASKFYPERWQLRWDGNRLIDAADKTKPVVIDPKTGKVIEGETVDLDAQKRNRHEGELEFCKASGAVAFSKDNNLWVAAADGTEHQLSSDGSREIVYGKSVHRDEFGIYKGTFWSPDGQQLAFYRMDQSMVADYPQVNTFEREATLAPDKYPMAGMTSHKVTVGIFSLPGARSKGQGAGCIYLDLGDPTDRYFTNIAWAPDGKTLYLYELNRDQNHTTLDAYDTTTGRKIKTLREESSDKYVEPLHPITFLPWDDTKFIYWSWKDGYKHLYLMDINGKELGQLTSGKWVVKELVGFCSATKSAIIITKEAGDLGRNIYRLDLKTKKRTLLDNGRGCHSAQLSADGRYLIDTWQEPTVPRACAVTDTKTGKQSLLRTAKDPWDGWYQPIFEQGTILAADGQTGLRPEP